jgi:hypothetical protein
MDKQWNRELRVLSVFSAFCCGFALTADAEFFPAVFAGLSAFAFVAARQK